MVKKGSFRGRKQFNGPKSGPKGPKKFSRDEGRSRRPQKPSHKLTGERTRGDWSGLALRRQPVVFVRAENYDPLEMLKPREAGNVPDPSNVKSEQEPQPELAPEPDSAVEVEMELEQKNSPVANIEPAVMDISGNLPEDDVREPELINEVENSVSDSDAIEDPVEPTSEPTAVPYSDESDHLSDSASENKSDHELDNESDGDMSSVDDDSDASSSDPEALREAMDSVSNSVGQMGLGEDSGEDMMSELDDDQIFALAQMGAPDRWEDGVLDGHEGDGETDDFSDCSFDELLDELMGDSPVDLGRYRQAKGPPGAVKAGKSKDRLTKRRRERLEAREAARATNFGNDPPLWQKYMHEITVFEVLDEIRTFAADRTGPHELRFPPLDSNAHWYVQELAQLHGLTPKVQGSNQSKHVVVSRTRRAGEIPHPSKLRRLMTRRKNFVRSDKRLPKEPHGSKRTQKGAKVYDGHVVGQHASQIDEENFGHRLMLRMGWTQGSGLGQNHGGIRDPIAATVKLTKRGLGQS